MSLSPLCRRACPVFTRREVWLPVPVPTRHRWGHQYQVSSYGRVRRLNPRTGHTRMLTTYVSKSNGYLCVSLGAYDKATRTGGCTLVHRLVVLAFIGPPPRDGYPWEVDHLGWDKARAHVNGLRWLRKDTNQWRWRFWTDEDPDPEVPPMTPDELADYSRVLRANGWPDPPLPKPWDTHRHPVAV